MRKKLDKILNTEHSFEIAHICDVGKIQATGIICERCGQEAELAAKIHLADPMEEAGRGPRFDADLYLCLSCMMLLLAEALDKGFVAPAE